MLAKMTTKKLIALVIIFNFSVSSVVFGQGPQQHSNIMWQKVGEAKLEVLWFDIYNATLFSASGKYEPTRPFKLEIKYLRSFSAEDLVEETLNQWQDKIPQEKQTAWAKQLNELWPDIDENDRLNFIVDDNRVGHFYFNGQYLGFIDDPEFAKPFSDIWLADDSQFPKLAKQLRGE